MSKGTVSKVINNYPGINADTRKRILRVIADHSYAPDNSAQQLAFRKTRTIGVLIPHEPEHSLNGAYWSSLVTSISVETRANDYAVELLFAETDEEVDTLVHAVVRRSIVDGLIISAELGRSRFLTPLQARSVPYVVIGRPEEPAPFSVDIDNEAASRAATEHLLNAGYRRVAYISGPRDYPHNTARSAGYHGALSAAGVDYSHVSYLRYEHPQDVCAAISELVKDRATRPDAFLVGAGGDFMFDVLSALHEHELSPPDVGFVTFDDYRFLDFLTPPITAVRQPMAGIGREAVRMLISLLNGAPPERQLVLLPAELVVRNSSTVRAADGA